MITIKPKQLKDMKKSKKKIIFKKNIFFKKT